jgi:exonuclease III
MKTLSWNCRGLGKLSAVRALKQLILAHHPDMVFLTETKFLRTDFSKKTNNFGLPNNFAVDCTITHRNRRGGIAMLWNNNVNINIIGFNDNMIDCYMEGDNNDNNWRAIGIYGYPKHNQKHLTCELISQLYHSNIHDKWLLFGDFNLIMNSCEKQGVEIPIIISLILLIILLMIVI